MQKYDLFQLTKASDEDREFLEYQELTVAVESAGAPHIVARVFLRDLIFRSGVLLNDRDVLARLGCAKEAAPDALPFLDAAIYAGLFGTPWKRWWSHRVDSLTEKLFGHSATSLTAAERAATLSERLGKAVSPALSPWNDLANEMVAFSCACCGESTELRHSVAVFEKSLPKYVSRRRICWDCVQTDRYIDKQPTLVIDESDAKLAARIKTKKRDGQEDAS
jgi:hypothetical protein